MGDHIKSYIKDEDQFQQETQMLKNYYNGYAFFPTEQENDVVYNPFSVVNHIQDCLSKQKSGNYFCNFT